MEKSYKKSSRRQPSKERNTFWTWNLAEMLPILWFIRQMSEEVLKEAVKRLLAYVNTQKNIA